LETNRNRGILSTWHEESAGPEYQTAIRPKGGIAEEDTELMSLVPLPYGILDATVPLVSR